MKKLARARRSVSKQRYVKPPPIIFNNACPNCKGTIDSERLYLGVPCKSCLKLPLNKIKKAKFGKRRISFLKFIAKHIDYSQGDGFKKIVDLELEAEKINDLSKKLSGNRLWSAQRTWAKRLVKGISFSITAPTGLGKTYFGMVASIYMARKKKKVLFVVPTIALVSHVLKKIKSYINKLGENILCIGYHAKMTPTEKVEFRYRLENRDFDIVVITSKLLSRQFDKMKHITFDFIFVDDVDALLKASENIDRVLYLVGFKQEHIKKALDLVRRKQNFMYMTRKTRKRLLEESNKFRREVEEYKKKNKVGQIIIASATGAARGLRVKVLRELLSFTVGSTRGGFRNIIDSYYVPKKKEQNVVVKFVKKLGRGGIIFVHRIDRKLVDDIVRGLESIGYKVGDATRQVKIENMIEAFADGKIDILVGAASYYGKLARGLDIPQTIRYAIFVGVPHFKFPLEVTEKTHPMKGFIILSEITDFVDDKEKKGRILRLISNFRKNFMRLKMSTKQEIIEAILQDKKLKTKKMESIKNLCLDILRTVKELLSDKKIVSALKKSPFVDIREEEGKLYIYIPDAKTYIQGSGRTSRLYAGGITKGLAVIVSRRKKLLEALKRRTKWYIEDIEWYDFKKLDLDKIIREIDRDRETVMKILEGKISRKFKELTRSALVIVESPTKAKTIARFFGKPARRVIGNFVVYEVTTGKYILDIVATRGHIYDLTLADIEMRDFDLLKNFFRVSSYLYGVKVKKKKNGKYEYIPEYDVLSICRDCGKRFTGLYKTCPRCGVQNVISQKEILDVIREVADEVDEILIATDPDAEGEKIGFDIALLLAPYAEKIRRIEYHAVTLAEIRKALKNPRDIDLRRVEAQLVRRILDRWVGFAFSHLLWKIRHITKKFFSYSAGRVQTPVLGWIIDRFEEHKKNRIYLYIVTLSNGVTIALEENDALKEKWKSLKGKTISVKIKKVREEVLNPLPPYNTAGILKDIAAQLKISATETMRILQELFESGLITYHRTDSTRVSPEGINVAKEYIQNTFGDLSMFKPRTWSHGEESAHECIRPTMPINGDTLIRMLQTGELVLAIRFTKRHYAVYQQIFKRFMASQMVQARVKKADVEVVVDESIVYNTGGIIEILEPGFAAVYPPNMLPEFKDGMKIEKVERMKISKSPLFTESDIIDKMRKERIGRPSTYAIILNILFRRGYVKASPFRKKVFPLKRGISIYKTLTKKIESYAKKLEKRNKKLADDLRKFITVEGTRELELEMDKIEKGESNYQEILEKIHRALSDVLKDLNKYYKKELLPKLEQRIENMIKKDSIS